MLNAMDFRHRSPLQAAPCCSMMVLTCCSLNALPLKNVPSEMMLPGLKSYCVCSWLCAVSASFTCTLQPMKRTDPTMMAIAAIAAAAAADVMPMRVMGFALRHVLRRFLILKGLRLRVFRALRVLFVLRVIVRHIVSRVS